MIEPIGIMIVLPVALLHYSVGQNSNFGNLPVVVAKGTRRIDVTSVNDNAKSHVRWTPAPAKHLLRFSLLAHVDAVEMSLESTTRDWKHWCEIRSLSACPDLLSKRTAVRETSCSRKYARSDPSTRSLERQGMVAEWSCCWDIMKWKGCLYMAFLNAWQRQFTFHRVVDSRFLPHSTPL